MPNSYLMPVVLKTALQRFPRFSAEVADRCLGFSKWCKFPGVTISTISKIPAYYRESCSMADMMLLDAITRGKPDEVERFLVNKEANPNAGFVLSPADRAEWNLAAHDYAAYGHLPAWMSYETLSALMMAVANPSGASKEVVRAMVISLMKAGANPYWKNERRRSVCYWITDPDLPALLFSSSWRRWSRKQFVRFESDGDGETPLHWAARLRAIDMLDAYVESGLRFSINARCQKGNTALMVAAQYAEKQDQVDVVKRLLALGADPNFQELRGERKAALHHAARKGNIVALKALLEAGADPNIQDALGRTPLLMACSQRRNMDLNVVRALLEAGADPNLACHDGHTPIYNLTLLWCDHAAFFKRTWRQDVLPFYRLLMKHGADINGTAQRRPLHWAAEAGCDVLAAQPPHPEVVHTLIELGADVFLPQDGIHPISPVILDVQHRWLEEERMRVLARHVRRQKSASSDRTPLSAPPSVPLGKACPDAKASVSPLFPGSDAQPSMKQDATPPVKMPSKRRV